MHAKRSLSACLALGLVLLSTVVVSTQGSVPTVPPAPTLPVRLFFPLVLRPVIPTFVPTPTVTPTATPQAIVPLRVDGYCLEYRGEDPIGLQYWLHVRLTNTSNQTVRQVHITVKAECYADHIIWNHFYWDTTITPGASTGLVTDRINVLPVDGGYYKVLKISAEGYVFG